MLQRMGGLDQAVMVGGRDVDDRLSVTERTTVDLKKNVQQIRSINSEEPDGTIE